MDIVSYFGEHFIFEQYSSNFAKLNNTFHWNEVNIKQLKSINCKQIICFKIISQTAERMCNKINTLKIKAPILFETQRNNNKKSDG